MGVPGRKSAVEELQIVKRYSVLSDKFFIVLKKHLTSKDEAKQKWAVEQLSKAYVKMIPQAVSGDPDNPLIMQFDQSFKDASTSSTKKNSKKSS